MVNTRAKGNRTLLKAIRYALTYPGTLTRPFRQVAWYAEPQEFDLIVFRQTYWPRFVEVRTSQWRVGNESTRRLAKLPGDLIRQIWRFHDRQLVPDIREWSGEAWVIKTSPWEFG